jgi:hypothetical protein
MFCALRSLRVFIHRLPLTMNPLYPFHPIPTLSLTTFDLVKFRCAGPLGTVQMYKRLAVLIQWDCRFSPIPSFLLSSGVKL